MEPKTRGRKLVPMYKHDNAWRHRQQVNSAKTKYGTDVLRTLYSASECPAVPQYPDLLQLILPEAAGPALAAGEAFEHSLGTEINSRKIIPRDRKPDAVPEWYSEPSEAKPVTEPVKAEVEAPKVEEVKPKEKIKVEVRKNVKNLQGIEDEEGRFSRVDELFEIKLKQQAEEPEEPMPEWDDPGPPEAEKTLPKYHSEVIKAQLVEGNPFSSILLDGVIMDDEGFICPAPSSKAYEKVWYYRDPQGDVQGAFDSVEMFNWYAAGYFTEDLHVSYASRFQFVPLSFFIEQQKSLLSDLISQPQPAKDEATKELKSMLGIKHSPWGSRQPVPVTSLADIQKEQARRG